MVYWICECPAEITRICYNNRQSRKWILYVHRMYHQEKHQNQNQNRSHDHGHDYDADDGDLVRHSSHRSLTDSPLNSILSWIHFSSLVSTMKAELKEAYHHPYWEQQSPKPEFRHVSPFLPPQVASWEMPDDHLCLGDGPAETATLRIA